MNKGHKRILDAITEAFNQRELGLFEAGIIRTLVDKALKNATNQYDEMMRLWEVTQ